MTDSAPPRYSLREFERRWLVDVDQAPPIPPGAGVTIQDRYLEGSRLRLRRAVSADGHTVYKLCKKYGDRPGAESITNLYLSAAEYRRLSALPGTVVEKHRHALADGSLDQYARDGDALMILEREFADADAAARFAPPAFAAREITGDEAFSGAALASRFGHVMPSTPSLHCLSGTYSVHRLPPQAPLPDALLDQPFFALLRSPAELSVCCQADFPVSGSHREDDWACLAVDGPLDFTLTGIIAAITGPLAQAGVPVFVMSSFDTDYVLIPRKHLEPAITTLGDSGIAVRPSESR